VPWRWPADWRPLTEVEKLERDVRLSGYHRLLAIKADLLSWIGSTGEADNEAERALLDRQIAITEGFQSIAE